MVDVSVPPSDGLSNEKLLLDVLWQSDGVGRRERMVARVAPAGYQVYPDTRFAEQVRVQEMLHTETDVPVLRIHGSRLTVSEFSA